MTGITEIVRACRLHYWHGRLGLLRLIALLPECWQPAVHAFFLRSSSSELGCLEDPVGPMPMPRLELFAERRRGPGPLKNPSSPDSNLKAQLAQGAGANTRGAAAGHPGLHVDRTRVIPVPRSTAVHAAVVARPQARPGSAGVARPVSAMASPEHQQLRQLVRGGSGRVL